MIGEPLRGRHAEAAEPADDEMGTVRGRREWLGLRPRGNLAGRGRRHDDLADMAGLLHQAERRQRFGRLEPAIRQRVQFAALEKCDQLGHQILREARVVLHELIDVDAEVGDVAAERAQRDLGVLVVVALAEFEEAAEGTHQFEAALHGFAGERIEHDVDALGHDRADLVVECRAMRDEKT